jgi:N-acetylmuramoyl-L-alanine amidase
MKSVIRRLTTLTALTATALGASAIASTSAIAQSYGQQPIEANRAVAIAEPVSNGRFYRLLILEQLTDQRACFEETAGTPTVIKPLLLNFDYAGICSRSSDSNGYSVRIGDQDLSSRYRLQVTRRGDNLVLVALPGALPGRGGNDLPVLEIGRSNGVANDFVKIQLDPGWQMARRTLNGSAQGHLYLSNSQSLETVAAQAGGARPAAAPVAAAPPQNAAPAPAPSVSPRPGSPRPPILGGSSLPSPGALPSPNAAPGAAPGAPSIGGGGSGEAYYQVIVPSSSPIVQSRVRRVASDAFMADVNGRRVIQAGLFQEQGRADQLVAQLSGQGIDSEIVQGRRAAAPPPSSTPSTPRNDTYYQVIVPDSGSNTRDRVNAVESGAFRTQRDGRSVIQAGRFRERDRAEQLQRRLADANLEAQIVESSGPPPVASAPRPSGSTPSAPRPRQGQLTVVIDPGHGGGDPGAVGIGGLREKDINLAISRRLQQVLQDKGINAIMTRSDDREVELEPRVDFADRANADVFVSIHANSISLSRPDVSGLETYYYSSGLRLAQTIHNSLLERTSLADRGVRRARFYVLVNTSMPAVLVETGFVTGSDDAARFRDPEKVNGIADGIAAGVLQYLNVQ